MESIKRRYGNIINYIDDIIKLREVENNYMESLKPTTKVSMSALQFITIIGVVVGFGWVCATVLYDIKTEINSVKSEIALIKLQLQIKGY